MALASDRQASLVDPSKGVYVEIEGIIEVRYMNDYGESVDKKDFYDFQNRQKQIPDDFCHKDRDTGIQAVFICLVCDCDLKSVKSLRDHAKGNKHIRKAVEKKRQILGKPLEPQNAPRIKKIKKEQPRIDVNIPLKERLRDSAQPAVGLPFIEEFRNPEDPSAHRMYSCTLPGCKSAWGTSDDIYHHVIKFKHARNFFKSEKKAQLGLVGGNFNSNLEPLGERKEKSSFGAAAGTSGGRSRDGRDQRESSSPLSRCQEFMNTIEDGQGEGGKVRGKSRLYKEFKTIKWMFENYRRNLDLHDNYKAPPEIGQQRFEIKMNEWKVILNKAEGELMEKLDNEEKRPQ